MKTVFNITSLESLQALDAALPDGTTLDIIGEDFSNGNFDECHGHLPEGWMMHRGHCSFFEEQDFTVYYTGRVADGYVSPRETHDGESDPR